MTLSWLRVLVAALGLASCAASQANRVPGEYIVTLAPHAGTAAISHLYGRFAIRSIQALGNNVYLVELSQDPGPAVMERLGREKADIEAVQPNYGYRTQRR